MSANRDDSRPPNGNVTSATNSGRRHRELSCENRYRGAIAFAASVMPCRPLPPLVRAHLPTGSTILKAMQTPDSLQTETLPADRWP